MFSNFRTWPIVAVTFAAVMLLSAIVTVLTFSRITALRVSVLTLTNAHDTRRDHIESLRARIYVSSILIRDLLLEGEDNRTADYDARLRDNHAAALRHMAGLQRFSWKDNSRTVEALAAEVKAYWDSVEDLLRQMQPDGAADGYAYVRSQVVPRRQAVIALAEELADFSAAEARSGREDLSRSMDEFHRDMFLLRTIATLVFVSLALYATVRVFRLERLSGAEHKRIETAEAELRKLSTQLVTAQEHERRSLSRELHDDVGQIMTALRFGLCDVEQHCGSPTRAFSESVQTCRTMLERAIERIRGIAMGLRPSMLDDFGLAAAIEWQAREFSRQFDIAVTVNIDPQLADWPEPQRTGLYRITQEALTNCARHAQAKAVSIDLTRTPHSVRLIISDDGVGMPAEPGRGFGLVGMHERVREFGGQLTMPSAAGRGTTVQVEIPVAGEISA